MPFHLTVSSAPPALLVCQSLWVARAPPQPTIHAVCSKPCVGPSLTLGLPAPVSAKNPTKPAQHESPTLESQPGPLPDLRPLIKSLLVMLPTPSSCPLGMNTHHPTYSELARPLSPATVVLNKVFLTMFQCPVQYFFSYKRKTKALALSSVKRREGRPCLVGALPYGSTFHPGSPEARKCRVSLN